MKISKQRKDKRIKKKISKESLKEKRSLAAKIKALKEKHRKKYPKKKTNKGFFIVLATYLKNKIKLRELLEKTIYYKKGANSTYSVIDLIVSLIGLKSLGIERIYHGKDYQEEKVLAKALEMEKFPSDTTLYRFLNKYGQLTMCRQINKAICHLTKPILDKSKNIVVDGDISTLRSYQNNKEGAEEGYNKLRPGQPCFQAIAYFANGFCIRPEIMQGKKAPLKKFAFVSQLKEVRKLVGRIDWLRLDAGFVNKEMLDELDVFSKKGNSTEKILYIVNAGTGAKGVKDAIDTNHCRTWKKYNDGSYFQEISSRKVYKESTTEHRMILLKQFDKNKNKWRYYALVTNDLESDTYDLCCHYHQRQDIEGLFDQGKNDYSLENLPSHKLMANSLYFSIIALTFNLLLCFRNDCLNSKDSCIRLKTLQRRYLNRDMPSNGSVLFLSRSLLDYRTFLAIFRRLKKLNILLEYRLC